MWKIKGSQGSTKLQAVRDSEVQYLAKAVFQGISLDKGNAWMTIIYFVALTLDQSARVFQGR